MARAVLFGAAVTAVSGARAKRGLDVLTFLGVLVALFFFYPRVSPREVTPVSWCLGVAVLVGGLYFNSRGWRRFNDAARAYTAAELGTDPQGLSAIVRQMRPLLESDPPAAERLLQQHFEPIRERDAARRQELVERAQDDPGAAATLYRSIEEQIAKNHAAIGEISRHAAADPGIARLLDELRREVAELERRRADITPLLTNPRSALILSSGSSRALWKRRPACEQRTVKRTHE